MEKWPIYYKDLLRFGNPDSTVGIATLWTICDRVIDKIDHRYFCLAGQLYTKNGINFLVRNLLANKKIRHLVICGQDRAGSGAEIIKLWDTGTCEGLHKEIPIEAVKFMTANVKLIDYRGEENPYAITDALKCLFQLNDPYGEPEIFPEPENETGGELVCRLPSEGAVFRITGQTIADTWVKALQNILRFGETKETDSMKIKELFDLSAVITNENPDNFSLPDWLNIDPEKIEKYLPQIMSGVKFEGLHYTYGNRLREHFGVNQIEEIIKKLKNDPHAREAVAPLFDARTDHSAEHRPCITLVQALYNGGKLNLNAYVRSHDIFGGWCLNAFGLRKLQKEICDQSGLPMGNLVIISASAHIYDFNWREAQEIVKARAADIFESDPRGYFVISIDREKFSLKAAHYGPENQLLNIYEENSKSETIARNLAKTIESDLGISLISHALYLGTELAKAEFCLKNGLDYTQDKPLVIP